MAADSPFTPLVNRLGCCRQAGKRNRPGGVGHSFLHSAIDDHSRLVYSEILTDEKKKTAAGFWGRANAI